MIGHNGPVDHFHLVRWAREQAHHDKLHTGTDPQTGEPAKPRRLRPIEAHVLLLLATYANRQGIAWPSIGRLAEDVGLKVKVRERRGRKTYQNSAITAALFALQDFGLIWSRQRGRGRAVERELLMPPASAGGNDAPREDGDQAALPPASAVPAPRERGAEEPEEEPDQKNQMTPPAGAGGRHPRGRGSGNGNGLRKLPAIPHPPARAQTCECGSEITYGDDDGRWCVTCGRGAA